MCADRFGAAMILQYINVLAKEQVRVACMNESLYIANKIVMLSFDRYLSVSKVNHTLI